MDGIQILCQWQQYKSSATKLSLCLYINKYLDFPNSGFLHCLLFFLICGRLFMVCSQTSQMTNILENIPCLVSSGNVIEINYLQVSWINITKFACHHNKNTTLETSWPAHESWFRRSKKYEVVQFSFEDVGKEKLLSDIIAWDRPGKANMELGRILQASLGHL